MARTLKIFFHDNCFDGSTSAALFSEFYRRHIDSGATIVLQGVQHKPGDPFEDYAIDGDDNACVDFRYSPHERMTWWFDHHISAFQPRHLKEHFDSDTSRQKFHDPSARSCAKFQADVLRSEFGFEPEASEPWQEVLGWADIIDGAQFDAASVVVELREPALQIMTWLEHNADPRLGFRLIEQMGKRPLAEIAGSSWVREPLEPILEQHRRNIDLIRERAVQDGGVVFFDLTRDGVGAHNKFIAYMHFPETRYTVAVTLSDTRATISVGYNPWGEKPRVHNIAEICERFGGGGHLVVGAVSFAPDDTERAREVAQLIRRELMED